MKSKGDSLARGADDEYGIGASLSVVGGEYRGSLARAFLAGDSLEDLERKLGMGSAEGAGEAWKVAPAKAAAGIPDFIEPRRAVGVLLSACASGETCAALPFPPLFLFRCFEFVWAEDWLLGAGDPESALLGVCGVL